MNRLNIGETILQLRKGKKLTQKQLASMVEVSAGAVSKWENGNSTPDISLLAPLARALDTSIDILLCFHPQLSEKEVMNIKQELIEIFLHEGYKKGEEKSLNYLNKYANSISLKYEVAGLIYMYLIMEEGLSEEFIKSKKMYSLDLLHEVVNSKDPKYTPMALFSIAHINMEMEDYEESEKALKGLPLCPIDPAVTYVNLYLKQGKDEDAIKLCSNKLLNYMIHSSTMLIMLANISKKKGHYDKAMFYLDTCYNIEKVFKIGLGSAAYNYSKLYIKINEKQSATKWFKIYVEQVLCQKYDHKDNPYFEKINLEINPEGQKIIRKKMLKSIIHEEDFKVLAGIEDYEKAIKELIDASGKI
ncbi:helix-turn-helix transcriptional regulator [Clostridium sp. Marseille-Q2269]|uniref:helix-turn-helix domain-containing protein n=1 Tax=Clostridium sp. Marseille-Q2269 TaxID=2942205 RepID=UPI002073DBCA|nr:helix-turn-helix transcriptional regulator [Clostridium sp. Marseille-Q2269]